MSRASVLALLVALALLASAPAAQADPVVAAAGDIACDSSIVVSSACHQAATSDILVGMDPLDAVLALGDLQYDCGELANFQSFYAPSWGRVIDKTYPVPGNHEYDTGSACLDGTLGGGRGYFTYFGDRATPQQPGCVANCKGYYSFDLGAWHIVALNSNCARAGGCDEGSPQETWLRTDLAATSQSCILAYWHHPRYASKGGASTGVQPLWAALYDGGADLILTGHSHNYERFARLGRGTAGSVEPTVDPIGMRELIVGTGGRDHHGFTTIRTGSEVRNQNTFGVLRLGLHEGSYEWEFLPEAGKTFTDLGSDTCQGAPRPGDTDPPSTPTDLTATATSPTEVELSWTAATDNIGVVSYGIYRDGTLIDTTPSTTYSDLSAQPETSYEYTVDAVDARNNRSAQSEPAGATTPPTSTAFRAASSAASATATRSLTLPAPAEMIAGDVMIASVDVRALQAITPPPGWTLVRSDTNSTVMTMATYYRVVEAGEPASYTWNFSLRKAAAGVIAAYSGVDTTAPIDAADGLANTSSSMLKAPSINSSVAQARLVGLFAVAGDTTITPPLGMVERGDVASHVGTDVTLEAVDGIQAVPGPTGQRKAIAASGGRSIGQLLALRPAG